MKPAFVCPALLLATATLVHAAESRGLKPRPTPGEYPSVKEHNGITIAARVLPSDEVRSGFATDLDRRYAVVEVAIYPAEGKSIEVSDIDFSLRYDNRTTWTRAASPRAAAAAIQRRNVNAGKNDVTLIPTIGIGHSTGPDWTDASGRRRSAGGTSVGTGVGVGIGGAGSPDPPAAATDADRRVMESELSDKSLPIGRITTPVAGYLYFPLPQRKTVVAEELEFDGEVGVVRLPLQEERLRTR
jgi:hypothetical protein